MILVTGSSGFIGQHLARALLQRFPTERLRLFDMRSASDVPSGEVEFLQGAIEDPAAAASAVQGARCVVHLAARVQPASRDQDELRRINVDGARNVFAAAVQAGCELFIHMSSAGVYGPPRTPDAFQESDATHPESPYQRTKLEAEAALRRIDPRSCRLIVLRPAGIYGPGSYLEIPAYKSILAQRFSIELRGGVIVHPTHVSDVVGAIVALIERPAPLGTIFNVGGERPLLHQDFQAMVAALLGVSRRRLIVPPPIARPVATLASSVLLQLGRSKPLLRAFSRGDVVSSAVNDRLFRQSYPSVPVVTLREGLRGHIEWARNQSLL